MISFYKETTDTSQLCLRGTKRCRGKNVLRFLFSIMEGTTNSGSIRSMEKVTWDEQTPNSPNKAGGDGNMHNSSLQTNSNVLREHSIFYLQLSPLPRTPTLYYGKTGAVSPKIGNFQRYQGGKNPQNKNQAQCLLPPVLQGYNLSTVVLIILMN